MCSVELASEPVRRGGANLPVSRRSELGAIALRFGSKVVGPFAVSFDRDARCRREAIKGCGTAGGRGDAADLLADPLRDAYARH